MATPNEGKGLELVKDPDINRQFSTGTVKSEKSSVTDMFRQLSGLTDDQDPNMSRVGSVGSDVSEPVKLVMRQGSQSSSGPMFRQTSIESIASGEIFGLKRLDSIGTVDSAISEISLAVANQTINPTCWSFGAAKIILKFLRRFFKKTLKSDMLQLLPPNGGYNRTCDKYYNIDKFKSTINQSVLGCLYKKNLSSCIGFEEITEGVCGEKEYNNLCLYMFIYFKLIEKYGRNSASNSEALVWFTNEFLTKKQVVRQVSMRRDESVPVVGGEPFLDVFFDPGNQYALDINTRAKAIMDEYHAKIAITESPPTTEPTPTTKFPPTIFVNSIMYVKKDKSTNTHQDCTVVRSHNSDTGMTMGTTYFIDDTKEAESEAELELSKCIIFLLQKHLYAAITIDLYGDANNRDELVAKRFALSNYKTSDENPTPPPRYEGGKKSLDATLIGIHTMTIVGYNAEKSLFKIKNSWGEAWGDKGTISISLEELLTHRYFEICYLDHVDARDLFKEFYDVKEAVKKAAEKAKREAAMEKEAEREAVEKAKKAAAMEKIWDAYYCPPLQKQDEPKIIEPVEPKKKTMAELDDEDRKNFCKLLKIQNQEKLKTLQIDDSGSLGSDSWDSVFDSADTSVASFLVGGARRRQVKRNVKSFKCGLKTRRKQKQKQGRKRFIKTRRNTKRKRGRKTRR